MESAPSLPPSAIVGLGWIKFPFPPSFRFPPYHKTNRCDAALFYLTYSFFTSPAATPSSTG
jgi:hypothetical protein